MASLEISLEKFLICMINHSTHSDDNLIFVVPAVPWKPLKKQKLIAPKNTKNLYHFQWSEQLPDSTRIKRILKSKELSQIQSL